MIDSTGNPGIPVAPPGGVAVKVVAQPLLVDEMQALLMVIV